MEGLVVTSLSTRKMPLGSSLPPHLGGPNEVSEPDEVSASGPGRGQPSTAPGHLYKLIYYIDIAYTYSRRYWSYAGTCKIQVHAPRAMCARSS